MTFSPVAPEWADGIAKPSLTRHDGPFLSVVCSVEVRGGNQWMFVIFDEGFGAYAEINASWSRSDAIDEARKALDGRMNDARAEGRL